MAALAFRDRFKDKAVIVGRDGENAMSIQTPNTPSTPTLAQRGSQMTMPMLPPPAPSHVSSGGTAVSFKIGQLTNHNKLMFQERKAQLFLPTSHQVSESATQQKKQPTTTRLPPIISTPKSAPPKQQQQPQQQQQPHFSSQIRSFSTGPPPPSSANQSRGGSFRSGSPNDQVRGNGTPPVVSLFGGFNQRGEQQQQQQSVVANTQTKPEIVSLFGGGGGFGNAQPAVVTSLFGGGNSRYIYDPHQRGDDLETESNGDRNLEAPKPSQQQQEQQQPQPQQPHGGMMMFRRGAPPLQFQQQQLQQQQQQLPPMAPTSKIVAARNYSGVPPPPVFTSINNLVTSSTSPHQGDVRRASSSSSASSSRVHQQHQTPPKPLFDLLPQSQNQQHQNQFFELQSQDSPFNRSNGGGGGVGVAGAGVGVGDSHSVSSTNANQIQQHNHKNNKSQRVSIFTGKSLQKHHGSLDTPKSDRSVKTSTTVASTCSPPSVQHAVDYKPYSVEDYRKLKESDQRTVHKSKGLGPNDSDEVRKARELKQMAKQYGESNNKVNMTVLPQQPKSTNLPSPSNPPPPSEKVLEARQRREKAREFARNVPKPTVRDIESLLLNGNGRINDNETPMTAQYMSPKQAAAEARRDRVLELEAQHERDRLMVETLKRQLKL